MQQEEVLYLVGLEVGLVEEQHGFEQHLCLLELERLYACEGEDQLEYNERNQVISYIHPARLHLCPGLNASIV